MEAVEHGGNSIAWNYSEFCANQLNMARSRADYNVLHKFQAIIPLVGLTFDWIEKHPATSDQPLYEAVR